MAQNLITKHEIENIVNLRLNKSSEAALREKLERLFSKQTVESVDFNSNEFKSSFKDIVTAFNAVFKEAGVDVIDLMPSEADFKKLGEIAVGKFMDAWKAVGEKGGMHFSFNTEQLDQVIEKLDIIAKNTRKTTKASLSKSADEINAAIYRLDKAQEKYKSIQKAIEYDGKKSKPKQATLDNLKTKYDTAQNWEDQYQYLIKYVKTYEKLKDLGDVEFTAPQTELYRTLAKQVDQAKAALSTLLLTKEQMSTGMTVGSHAGTSVTVNTDGLATEKTLGEIKQILQDANKKKSNAPSEPTKESVSTLEDISDTKDAISKLNNIRANDKLSGEDQKNIEAIEKSISAKFPKQLQDTIYKILQNADLDGTQEKGDKLYRDLYKYELAAWSRDGQSFQINKQNISTILGVYAEIEKLIAPLQSAGANFNELSSFRESMLSFLEDEDKFDLDHVYDNVYPYMDEVEIKDDAGVKEFIKEATSLIASAAKIPFENSSDIDDAVTSVNTADDIQDTTGLNASFTEISETVALSDKRFKELNDTLSTFISNLTQGANGDYSGLVLNENTVIQLIDSLNTLTRNSGNEHGTFFNSKTGEFSEIISGVGDEIRTSYKDYVEAAKKYDTRIHSHSATIAAPSVLGEGNDLQTWIDALGTIKKQIIVTKNELLSLDFSSLNHKQLRQIKSDYEAEVLKIQDETSGTEELNVKMRAVWDKIIKSYGDHIMTSYKVPNALSENLQEQNVKATINEASLKSLLERIVYNVKIENDNSEDSNVANAVKKLSDRAGTTIAQDETLKNLIQSSNNTKSTSIPTYANPPKVEDATQQNELMRTAIFKELAKYGTFQQAKDAGRGKIEFDGQEIQFGRLVSDYFKKVLDSTFNPTEFEKLWREARKQFYTFTPKELTRDDAVDILREKMPENILEGWFRQGDSEYKAKIEELALSDDDIRNAALNIMWDNYKNSTGKNIDFNEFLHSDIPMYRGKNSEKYTTGDETLAFTFDRKVAETFGKYVLETLIKPIETLGAYQTTGESEALVYRKQLEDRAEYKQWYEDMGNKTTPQAIYSSETVEAIKKETTAHEENAAAIQKEIAKHNEIEVDGSSNKIPNDKTQPTDTTAEVQSLENVRKKVEDIKTEVEAQTSAFTTEEAEVKRVANTEIEALNPLEQKVKGIQAAIKGLDEQLPIDVPTESVDTTLAPPETPLEETKPEIISEEEIAKLANLRDQVKGITDEIKSTINNVVADETGLQKSISNSISHSVSAITTECGELGKLNSDVEKVTTNLKGLFENITDGKANITDGLSNINVTVNHPETQQNDLESVVEAINGLVTKLNTDTVEHKDNRNNDGKKDATETTAKKTARDTNRINRSATKISYTLKSIKANENSISSLGNIIAKDATLTNILASVNEIKDGIKSGDFKESKEDRAQDIEIAAKELGELQARQTVGGNVELLSPKIQKLESYLEKKGLSQEEKDSVEQSRSRGYKSQLSELQLQDTVRKDLIIQDDLMRMHKRLGEAEGRFKATGEIDKDLSFFIDDLKREIESKMKLLLNPEGVKAEFEQTQNKSKTTTMAQIKRNKEKEWLEKYNALKKKYEEQARLQVEVDATADPEKEVKLKRLKEEVLLEMQKLGIFTKQRKEQHAQLTASYKQAKIRAEEDLAAKREKKSLKDQMKEARQEARDSKMRSTRNKGDDVLGSLWRMEDVPIDTLKTLPDVIKLQDALKTLKATRSEIDTKIKSGQDLTVDDSDKIKTAIGDVNKYSEAIKELIKNYEFFSDNNSTDLGRKLSPGEDIKTQLIEAAQALHGGKIKVKQYDAATQQLTYTIKSGEYEFTEYTTGVRNVDGALRTVQGTTKKTETLFELLGRKTKDVLTYFSGSTIIYKGIEELRKGIQYVREIDAALTELKKVTDETETSYDRFLNTASKTADKIGSTIAEVVSSTADFARLGSMVAKLTSGPLYSDI